MKFFALLALTSTATAIKIGDPHTANPTNDPWLVNEFGPGFLDEKLAETTTRVNMLNKFIDLKNQNEETKIPHLEWSKSDQTAAMDEWTNSYVDNGHFNTLNYDFWFYLAYL